jgi:dihydroorotase-like cyclic amidohydrolase
VSRDRRVRIEAYAPRPAQLYGLWPAKGRLDAGADADLVLVDPQERWAVKNVDVLSEAGWTPFEGRTLVGRVVRTYVPGELVAAEGRVVGEPGRERFLPGAVR